MHTVSREDTYAAVRQSHQGREWAAFELAVPTHILTQLHIHFSHYAL